MIFTTEACQQTFKIQKVPLNCDSAIMLYSLKRKSFGKVPYFEKANTKFCYRFNIKKISVGSSEGSSETFSWSLLFLWPQWNWWLRFCDFLTRWNTWAVERKKNLLATQTLNLLPDRSKWKGGILILLHEHIFSYYLKF